MMFYFVFELLIIQLLISFVAAAPGKSNSFSLTRTTTTQKSKPAVDLRQPSEIFSRSKNKTSHFHLFITIDSIWYRLRDSPTIMKSHIFEWSFIAAIGQPTRSSPTLTTTNTKAQQSTIYFARETFSRSTHEKYLFPYKGYDWIYSCSIDQLPLLIILNYADCFYH